PPHTWPITPIRPSMPGQTAEGAGISRLRLSWVAYPSQSFVVAAPPITFDRAGGASTLPSAGLWTWLRLGAGEGVVGRAEQAGDRVAAQRQAQRRHLVKDRRTGCGGRRHRQLGRHREERAEAVGQRHPARL